MRQRFSSHTTLIELAAALLCFLLASVIILGLFTKADAISRSSARLLEATTLAQDCAEWIAGSGDALRALEQAGFQPEGESLMRRTDSGLTITVVLNEKQTEVGNLIDGQICVLDGEEELISIPTARYYNKEVIHP